MTYSFLIVLQDFYLTCIGFNSRLNPSYVATSAVLRMVTFTAAQAAENTTNAALHGSRWRSLSGQLSWTPRPCRALEPYRSCQANVTHQGSQLVALAVVLPPVMNAPVINLCSNPDGTISTWVSALAKTLGGRANLRLALSLSPSFQ